ncbi:hypothetical protein D3C85_866070 [compost metagenome]
MGGPLPHDGAHQVVHGDDAHHQGVLVHHHGEVAPVVLEVLHRLVEVQGVGNDDDALHQGAAVEIDALAADDADQQLLGVHEPLDAVEVVVTDQELVVGVLGNLGLDALLPLLQGEVDEALAGRHGGGDAEGLQLEHVLDELVLLALDDAGLGARIHHRIDVVRGDLVVAHHGDPQQAEQGVGQAVEEPHQRHQQGHAQQHGAYHHHRNPFRHRHGQALGHQVRYQDEHAGDEHEGGDRAYLGEPGALIEAGDQRLDGGVQGGFAQDAAQDGDGIEANLHHGKEVTRLGLQCQHFFGMAIALVGHHLQLDLAGGGERDLGEREEHTAGDQQHQKEQTIGKTHD